MLVFGDKVSESPRYTSFKIHFLQPLAVMKLKNAQIFEGDTPQKTNKCPPENHRLEDVFPY